MRVNAAVFLGTMGKTAEPAVPASVAMLKQDEYRNARVAAVQALGEIGDKRPAVMDALWAATRIDTDAGMASTAAQAFGRIRHPRTEGEGGGNCR